MRLQEKYHQDKDGLLVTLQKSKTLQEAIDHLDSYLAAITSLEGDYISSLTRPQARIALTILGVYQQNLRKFSDTFEGLAKNITESMRESAKPSHERTVHSQGLLSAEVLGGVGAAALIAGMLTNPFIGVPLAAGVGLLASRLLHADSNVAESAPLPTTANSADLLQTDPGLLLSGVEELFATVDRVVQEYGELQEAARPKPITPKLEDHLRFLEFLQDLLGWYQRNRGELPEKATSALDYRFNEQLPDLLSEHDIQVKKTLSDREKPDSLTFDIDIEVGEARLTESQIVRPAFLKQDQVLLRGRLIQPHSIIEQKP